MNFFDGLMIFIQVWMYFCLSIMGLMLVSGMIAIGYISCTSSKDVNAVASTRQSNIEMGNSQSVSKKDHIKDANLQSFGSSQIVPNLGSDVVVNSEKKLQESILEGFLNHAFEDDEQGEQGEPVDSQETLFHTVNESSSPTSGNYPKRQYK